MNTAAMNVSRVVEPAPLTRIAFYYDLYAAAMSMNMMNQVIFVNVIGPIRIIGSVGPSICSADVRATLIAHASVTDLGKCNGSSVVAPT